MATLLAMPADLPAQAPFSVRLWSRVWGSSTNDQGQGVARDAASQRLCGRIHARVSSTNRTTPAPSASCSRNTTLAGARLWSRLWGPTNAASGHAVAIDQGGAVYVTGQTWGDMLGQTRRGQRGFLPDQGEPGRRP